MTEGYRALRHGAAWLDLRARGRIEAHGRDRARFLHNVTSNDIKNLKPGSGCYAFLLTPQGRIVGDLYVYAFEDRFLLDTEPELREKVRQHILKYKVADQIELEDVTERTAAIGVEGPGSSAAELVACLGQTANAAAPFNETGQPGFRIYCSAGEYADLVRCLEAAGAVPATAEEARTVRIENGKPRYGDDILETTLPQETGQMQAISFNKGCYIGQEIVERIRARGHVNRKLVRLELDELPTPGSSITVGGHEAQVTSAVRSPESGKAVALAYERL